ncbi:hypothetical protein P780_03450 [Vibrio mimicus CAIM 1882]|nr:hypothetical protein P780_03450 [Vibrio mimicus CAIM 1882]
MSNHSAQSIQHYYVMLSVFIEPKTLIEEFDHGSD